MSGGVLHYVELRGRAELIRSMLQYVNAPYKDNFIKMGDQEQLMQFPLCQVPVWEEVDRDGKVFTLNQSQTIARHLARKHGLLPIADLKKAAMIESVQDCWTELRDLTLEYLFATDETKKGAMKKLLEKFKKHQSFHGELIDGKNHYFDDRVTLADFALYDVFDQIVRIDKVVAYDIGGRDIVSVYEYVGKLLQRYHKSPRYLDKAIF